MRILWVSHSIPYPPKAGFLLRQYNLLKEVSLQHTVDLVAFIQEPWLRTIFKDVPTGISEAHAALSKICREIHFVPIASTTGRYGRHRTALRALFTGRSYTTLWLDQPDAHALIAKMAQTNSYDLIHFDTIGLTPYRDDVGVSATTLGHHNIESHLFERRGLSEKSPARRWYYRREARLLRDSESQMADRFSANITCSSLDSERLRELAPNVRTYCVPNGVDCSYFKPQPDLEVENSILFLGTLNWHPNVDAMLFFLGEVWDTLKMSQSTLHMHIVGANAPRQLIQLASEKQDVHMHGFVEDVRPYFARAQVFVCPIMDGGGTKLKLLDAFAMGKAVVAHPIAMEGIDAQRGVHLEVAETAAEFRRAILELLHSPERRAQLGLNARNLVEEHYSFNAIGRDFSDFLGRLVSEPVGQP